MGVSGGPNIIEDGLVLALDAADINSYIGSGTIWKDMVGNNNVSLINGPTFSSTNGGGIIFDGTNDYALLPNGILSGTGNFTINQFIKCNGGIGGATFANYPAGTIEVFFGTRYIGLWLNNNSTYLGTSPWSTQLTEFTTNNVMITAVRSGITTFFYINGILQKTGSSSSSIGGSATEFRIGTNTSGTEQYNGIIYTTQVYNRALSAAEILQNYNSQKSRFNL
jgi:hypothetical protein